MKDLNEKKAKKPSPVAAIVIAAVAMLVFWLVQVLISGVGIGIESVKLMTEYAVGSEEYLEQYQNVILSSEFLTPVTVISQFVIVGVFLIWYFFGYIKKTSKEEKKEINKKYLVQKLLQQ